MALTKPSRNGIIRVLVFANYCHNSW